jgi:OFA family oxalate/formate antiporter-like MFS transporter
MNRGMVVVGAILIQLCLGAIYAWSVFTPPLAADTPADVVAVYGSEMLGIAPGTITPADLAFRHEDMIDDEQKLAKAKSALAKAEKDLTSLIAKKGDLSEDEYGSQRQAIVLKALRSEMEVLDDKLETLETQYKKLKKGEEVTFENTLLTESIYTQRKKALVATMVEVGEKYDIRERVEALQFGMTKAQTQMIFAAGLATFAVVMVIAGRIMPKVGPRALAMAGGVVLGVGYLLAGLIGPGQFMTTFVFVGLIGGAGIGLGYVVPIAVGMKWFPDRKGLITGLAVAGFGFGALLWVKLAGRIELDVFEWQGLIALFGLGTTFIVYGVAFAVLCLIGALWMRNPPEGWLPPGYKPPEAAADGQKPVAGTVDFTSGQMLKTPQFYMIFLCFVFGAGAGLMSIGLMKLFPKEALQSASNLSAVKASAVAGTAMAVFFSLANGIGRIAWGTLSDLLGRKLSIFLMLATQGVLVIAFQWMAGTPGLLYLGAALIGFNFGGNFALFPTITADTFGTKYIGQNYGWVFLSYGVGGIFGPILGGKLGDLDRFPLAFSICGALCLVAAVIIALVRHPKSAPASAAPETHAEPSS